jgi:hypothetical protein
LRNSLRRTIKPAVFIGKTRAKDEASNEIGLMNYCAQADQIPESKAARPLPASNHDWIKAFAILVKRHQYIAPVGPGSF